MFYAASFQVSFKFSSDSETCFDAYHLNLRKIFATIHISRIHKANLNLFLM